MSKKEAQELVRTLDAYEVEELDECNLALVMGTIIQRSQEPACVPHEVIGASLRNC